MFAEASWVPARSKWGWMSHIFSAGRLHRSGVGSVPVPNATRDVRAVRRFSAVFRWNPEILLSLIYRSAGELSSDRMELASGTYVTRLRFAAFGRLAITVQPENIAATVEHYSLVVDHTDYER